MSNRCISVSHLTLLGVFCEKLTGEGGTPGSPPPPPLGSIDYRGGMEDLVEKRTHAHRRDVAECLCNFSEVEKKEQSREGWYEL